MPLSVHEKAVISDLVSNTFPYIHMYYIRRRFLNAYILLWKQKNPLIKREIATHIVKEIFHTLKWNNKNLFPELENFFIESILAAKIENDFMHRLFSNSQVSRATALETIEIDYHQKLTLTLNEIFKEHVAAKIAAKNIFNSNMNDLKNWAKNFPTPYFSEERHQAIKAQNKLRFYFAFTVFVTTYLMLSGHEDGYAFSKSLAIASVMYFISGMYEPWRVTFLYLGGIYDMHLNLISLDDYKDEQKISNDVGNRQQKKIKNDIVQPQPQYPATIQVVIDKNPPPQWSDNIEDLPAYKIITKEKIKTRKAPTALPITIEDAPVTIETLCPDFFGDEFKELDATHIVPIDPANLGRNNSFFGIWNKPKITRNISDDQPIYKKLFNIFRTGNVAAKKGSSGIKYLRNLNFFEIKTPADAARVYGDEIIQVREKNALIFTDFSSKGFH
jgi:hypothetical protein